MTLNELLQDIDHLDLHAGRVATGVALVDLDSHSRQLIENVIRKLEDALTLDLERAA